MSTHLRSQNIFLQFTDDDPVEFTTVDQLWQTLRRTAVEPGQSSSPDFPSFADDCLLCTRIVTNGPALAHIGDENACHDDSLWDPDVPTQSPSTLTSTVPPPPARQIVGLVYLHAGPANIAGGEANIGVITKPDMQRRGYAREAVQLVLRWAFEELRFHRVQAAVLDTAFKDRALRLFIGSGFTHEGTKRRAAYHPEGEGLASVWKDVTCLAMLDTEWMLKSAWARADGMSQPPVVSVWDEMFARHAKEREELVRWEEKHGRVRKTSSMETLRECTNRATQDLAYLTDDASSISASSSPPSPRPNLVVTWEEDAHMADDHPDEPRQSWEEVVENSLAARRHRQWLCNTSLNPSLQGHLLVLPSIPSTRLSEGNMQSPLTISTPSSPGATPPPLSPSPSPAPSSVHSAWTGNSLLQGEDPFAMRHPSAGSSSRTRSRSTSVSSVGTDDWSDAQSSVSGSSGWDIISNASDSDGSNRT